MPSEIATEVAVILLAIFSCALVLRGVPEIQAGQIDPCCVVPPVFSYSINHCMCGRVRTEELPDSGLVWPLPNRAVHWLHYVVHARQQCMLYFPPSLSHSLDCAECGPKTRKGQEGGQSHSNSRLLPILSCNSRKRYSNTFCPAKYTMAV